MLRRQINMYFMLLAADVAAGAMFQGTNHDVIQRMGGGVEMFSYGKPTRSISNAAEVLAETFP